MILYSKLNSESIKLTKNKSKKFNLAVKKYYKKQLKKGNYSKVSNEYLKKEIKEINFYLRGKN